MYTTGNYIVSTPPSEEPITTAEAKAWLKVEHSDDDTLIASLIAAARQSAEKYMQRGLMEQEITETYPGFVGRYLRLSISPLVSVDTIKYRNTAGVETTLTAGYYGVDLAATPPLVYRKENAVWPQTENAPDSVEITYTVGYADAASVPDAIKTGILLTIADWYDNRTDSVRTLPTAAQLLFNQYRVWMF